MQILQKRKACEQPQNDSSEKRKRRLSYSDDHDLLPPKECIFCDKRVKKNKSKRRFSKNSL